VLLAAGGALFLAFVHDGGADRRRLTRVVVAAAAVGAFGLLAGVPVQAARATGLGWTAIVRDGVLGDTLGEGVGWSVATGLIGLGLIVVGLGRSAAVAVVGAIVAAASFALTGHTRVSAPVWLATTVDAFHLVAVATWFGGLVLLATALVARRARPVGERAVLVVRFSALAAVVLTVVLAAGLTLGWFEVRAVRALTSTTYGWLFLVKVTIVAGVVAVAAWNRWRLLPAVTGDGEDEDRNEAAARLRRAVTFEVAGLVAVVGVTALLVNVTPARVEAGVGTTFSTTVPIGDGSVNVVVDPNRVGRNALHLYLSDATGRPGTAEELAVELSLPAADIGPLRRLPVDIGSGHWLLTTDDLSISGRWRIDVVARVDQFTEETATTEVVVNP
jgi:copper transport protein